jgi:hypothetical protein
MYYLVIKTPTTGLIGIWAKLAGFVGVGVGSFDSIQASASSYCFISLVFFF